MDNFNTSRVHIASCRRTSEALGAQVCALVLSLNQPLFNYEGELVSQLNPALFATPLAH